MFDQFCVEEAIRKMATTQPVLDRKRKRDQHRGLFWEQL